MKLLIQNLIPLLADADLESKPYWIDLRRSVTGELEVDVQKINLFDEESMSATFEWLEDNSLFITSHLRVYAEGSITFEWD